MTERVYLAIDLGAESGRVIAGRLQDGRVSLDEIHRFPNGPVTVAGTRRWDVLRLWSDILEGLSWLLGSLETQSSLSESTPGESTMSFCRSRTRFWASPITTVTRVRTG